MTISQLRSSQGSRRFRAAFLHRAIRAIRRWQERRRAKAELARLAKLGDYLLRDVGLDPMVVRQDPAAVLDRIVQRPR